MLNSRFCMVYITIWASISPTLHAEPRHCQSFWCSNDKCIGTRFVCNNVNTCGDNSDNRSCEGCRAGSFSCGRNGECIAPALVCDWKCDCEDNCIDEEECFYDNPEWTTVGTLPPSTTTPPPGPDYKVIISSVLSTLIPILCLCGFCGWKLKQRLARKPWTAPSDDNAWTAPPGDNEAPSGNNEWTPPSVDNEWRPPPVNLEGDSAVWQSGLEGYVAPQYYPHSDSSLPPAYDSVEPTEIDIEDGKKVPPPNYETIEVPSTPLDKY